MAGLKKCEVGLVLPVWEPQDELSVGDRVARGFVYFLGMLYMFIGVSIISDRFMASIEVITSKEKEIKVKRPNGDVQIVVVRVWNETVANLTLMALGSSAPEILLSIIEIMAKHFDSGDLGPGTIVGSAAFNLLIIIAICVYVIPPGEIRRIKHLRVFFVTAAWSVFAYIWLLVILKVTSPGIVDVWEAAVTFLFFPATVGTAYIADRRLLIYKYLSKNYRMNRRGIIVEGEGGGHSSSRRGTELGKMSLDAGVGLRVFEEEDLSEEIRDFEQSRRDYIQLLRDLRKKYPNIESEQLEILAREEIMNKAPKSRAFYRMQATRKLIGGQNLMKKIHEKATSESSVEQLSSLGLPGDKDKPRDEHVTRVYFDPGHYTVMENVGSFTVTVTRDGGDLSLIVLVDYKTEDGTATEHTDYIPIQGTLTFGPEERHKTLDLQVLDDDVFEEDEHFYIRLSNVRFASPIQSSTSTSSEGGTTANGEAPPPGGVKGGGSRVRRGSALRSSPRPEVTLVNPVLATVMILDDDHSGIFNLGEKNVETVESIGTFQLKVTRWSGARGMVSLPYCTIEGTAKPGKDYEHVEGELIFQNNQTENYIEIPIIEEDSYEKDTLFYVEIKEPRPLEDEGVALAISHKDEKERTKAEKIALLGWPKLGSDTRAQIRIKESKEFKNTVDKLLQRANASLIVGTSSWKEQFIEAITVNGGDDGDEDAAPTCGDYVMHFLTIFWKILFAFVPPTDIFDGYVTFVVSILVIGALTAVIGDLASHLGCTVGLEDSVTAIALVALGTSVPDTFASKVAAIQDEFADASVGNVTGSNAVNVFLGIGIAWSIAAIYHTFIKVADPSKCIRTDLKSLIKTKEFCPMFVVDPGSLAFNVTMFCACAVIAISIMLLRRLQMFGGGELGGPARFKYSTTVLFVCLWLIYVIVASLEAYKVIEGF